MWAYISGWISVGLFFLACVTKQAGLPVEMKCCNLGIVPLKVGEVEEVWGGLLLSVLPGENKGRRERDTVRNEDWHLITRQSAACGNKDNKMHHYHFTVICMLEKQFNVHFQNKPSAQNICSGVHEKREKKHQVLVLLLLFINLPLFFSPR